MIADQLRKIANRIDRELDSRTVDAIVTAFKSIDNTDPSVHIFAQLQTNFVEV